MPALGALVMFATIGMAFGFARLRERSARSQWLVFSAMIVPFAIFCVVRPIWHLNPNGPLGLVAGTLWSVAGIGLVLSGLARYSARPGLMVVLAPLYYVAGVVLVFLIGSLLGGFDLKVR